MSIATNPPPERPGLSETMRSPPIAAGVLVFCLFHFALVFLGAMRLSDSWCPAFLAEPLSLYGRLTGAGSGYGFFAPNVPDQVIARITGVDDKGRTEEVEVGAGGRELDFRASSMLFLFVKVDEPDLLARSLAAYSLGMNPAEEKVTVVLGFYRVPRMTAYRYGETPRFDEFYRAVFMRTADLRPQP